MGCAAFEIQRKSDRGQGQNVGLGTHYKLVKHHAHNKQQRIEQFKRRVEIDSLFQGQAGLDRVK